MGGISTHVLDVAAGRPATGLAVRLEGRSVGEWVLLTESTTDDDGRVGDLLGGRDLEAGEYRITFDTGSHNPDGFYPSVSVVFRVASPDEHHHVPLLLSPFGYSTYRGS
jgi:5-hydroxyisourate hydrolase